MNERIKELAIQSGLDAPYGSDHEGLRDFDYRKFAELIVRESIVDFYRRYLDLESEENITEQVNRYVKDNLRVEEYDGTFRS